MASNDGSNELRLTRVYDAPLRDVWDAWTIPEQVEKWWGPRGFTLTTHERDLRAGGTWRYTMHGPDGVDYPNVTLYHVVEPYQRLVYDHGATDDTPPLFRVTATFSESLGKTTLSLVFALATAEAAAAIAKFIKKAGGEATWDRLAEHVERSASGRPRFVINRSFDAPITRVLDRWTQPEHLAGWLSPERTALHFLRSDIAPGKSAVFVITGAHGAMHVRADYLAIEAPHRIVYVQQFIDEAGQPAPAPGAPSWPPALLTTVVLAAEGPERTRVTVTTEPHGEVTAAELDAFVGERGGMTRGWTGSFDKLEALVVPDGAGG